MSYKVSFKLYSNGVSILFTYKLIYLNLENIKRFNSDLLFFHVKLLLCTIYYLFSRRMCVLHLLGRRMCVLHPTYAGFINKFFQLYQLGQSLITKLVVP